MDEQTRRSTLNASIKDGVAYSVMQGLGERNVQTCAEYMQAASGAFGALVAISMFAGGVFQVIGANIVDTHRRRKIYFVIGAVVQATSWALAFAALFVSAPWNMVLLIVSHVVYQAALNFTIPPWSSVMGEVVHEDRRGRFFGRRNFLAGAGQLLSMMAAAALLDRLKPLGMLQCGFAGLFGAALVCRLVSTFYLTRMHEPTYKVESSDRFSFVEFIGRAPWANFGRFVIYATVLIFGVAISGPFFGMYMLRDLKWSYGLYMAALSVQLLALFAMQPIWGRIADRWGNKIVMSIGGVGVSLIPIFWLVSDDPVFLLLAEAYDGAVWSAFQLASWNYLYDAVTPPKRARCTAYYNLLIGAGILAGALVGGFISDWAPRFVLGFRMEHAFTLNLIVSAVLRLGAATLLPTFRELRVRVT